ncbi:MAG: DUF6273 domain-containing protein [Defluviitaleaceae bacterium]|nr:DUF6273 domain-containing protein [Defluviitaleaceae bacterium]
MFDAINQVLRKIKTELGSEIFNDSSRFSSALNDLCDNKKVRNLIRVAVCDLRAYTRLKNEWDKHTVLILAQEMSEDYMIPHEISVGVIECVADLIGHSPHTHKIPPRPAKTEAATCVIHAPGNIVRFGFCNWRVMDVQSGKALIISDKILTSHHYHQELTNISWENCTLRRYLNHDFYNTFSEEEKERIVKNRDKIFLLSVEEAKRYFGAGDRYNSHRKTVATNGNPTWWWLRTQGEAPDFAAYVNADGMVCPDGFLVNLSGGTGAGVRPALWINLQ